MSALAKRYARAAFDAATTNKAARDAADALSADLQAFAAAFAASRDLREALRNPSFKSMRHKVLEQVFANLKLGTLATRLIGLLADNDRIEYLSDVAAELQALADESAGRLRAVVRSAVALSAAQQERLSAALQRRCGKPVALSVELDETLLGGLVCQVGDLTLDSSLKRQLDLLTERLRA